METTFFDSRAVEVTDAYYKNALALDTDNLLVLDKDRLLAGFRETAAYIAGMGEQERLAFMKHKKRYGGGWENALIGGHTLGHYMTAVAQGTINPGLLEKDREALRERLDSIVEALWECQEMTVGTEYEGYLFGAVIPETDNLDSQFDHVDKQETNIVNQAWVPWYTMHKILAGLLDAGKLAGNERALDMAVRLAGWVAKRVNAWSVEQKRIVLSTEYGGMNDVLYELYKVTGDDAHWKAAHQFDETELFEQVLAGGENALAGKHANTTIPKFLGALCRYEADTSETIYLDYAKAFWEMVIGRHTYITGGNSEDEHFGPDAALFLNRTNCNNETCNTYNMLKLSRRLFLITGEKKYADYYENTLINAIMSSQDHKTGRTMYFQPMATGYQKIFGSIDGNFWCCTGSGMENFTKLQDSIYFVRPGVIGVNLYLASRAEGDGYLIEQTGDLSEGDTMTFAVSGDAVSFSMLLRVPDWVKGQPVVRFGGEIYEYGTENGYICIPAEKLAGGNTFTIQLFMEVRAENLPDGENTYAFRYGPFVLSARLGTDRQTVVSHGVSVSVPGTKAVTRDTIGIQNASSVKEYISHIQDNLIKKEGVMEFALTGTKEPYIFTPHYNQDEESYGIYWTFYVDEDGKGAKEVLAEKEEKRLLETVVDRVEQVGRGQYESRFLMPDGETKDGLTDGGSVGQDAPALTRKAKPGGFFVYKMQVEEAEELQLVLTFLNEDIGKPIRISIGDTVIAEELAGEHKSKADGMFFNEVFEISKEVVEAAVHELSISEQGEEKAVSVIDICFAGTESEASARICKSVLLKRPYRTENDIVKIICDGKEIKKQSGAYTIVTPYDKNPKVLFCLMDNGGYVEFAGNAIDEKEEKTLVTSGAETVFEVDVYAQNFEKTSAARILVKRDYSGLDVKPSLYQSFRLDGSLDGALPVGKADKPEPLSDVACEYVDGPDGKALLLTGEYGLLLLDDTSPLGKSYTISFWMKPEQTGASYDPALAGGNFARDYWLNLTMDGKMWSSNGGWVNSRATGVYRAGIWQHVALVVHGERKGTVDKAVYGELYLDGKRVNSGNIAADLMLQPGAGLYFGINPWDAVFTGSVCRICLFDRAFSEVEVQALADINFYLTPSFSYDMVK